MATKFKIKKGDTVIVHTGKDKGKTGVVQKMLIKEQRVLVEGVNVVTKHVKPSMHAAGGIEKRNLPIHISNVALVDPKTQKATKVGMRIEKDGTKVRYAKASGEVIGR